MKQPIIKKISFSEEPFNNIVVFDLETTGLFPRSDEIIQIGAVRIINGKIKENDSFFTYVKPSEPISEFITELTGITNKDVEKAPKAKQILPVFSKFCDSSLLVAHNGACFDIPFIRESCYRHKIKTRNVSFIDSMHISWNVWGRKELSHSLSKIKTRLKVCAKGLRRHDARGDVHITANCVCKMVNRLIREDEDISLKLYSSIFPEMAF
jgi:DNA polymerase III epsilon subunit family exonuclease